ncbi:hypothetical protein EAS56_17595 [Bradyrhizobium guangzhouense]|uniref:Uncharacterized protein n=1 Tax=Bradyrhizobium guangzhouense TaxID=1325095 RepID=A0ABY0E7M2_9BRAD|nr:hypothetical protein EAS56_17595 [Bradyrhizobium guangzhouense]
MPQGCAPPQPMMQRSSWRQSWHIAYAVFKRGTGPHGPLDEYLNKQQRVISESVSALAASSVAKPLGESGVNRGERQ